ncbi:MAG: hypothetical protein JOZ86_12630 [Candidatus Eremiobacteraeota bacterium]|nr:hypothetical protein [Candidatus Eremiobacteraeota bacterium]
MRRARLELHRRRLRLESVFNAAEPLSSIAETKSLLTRYLCVLLSGFIERSVKDAINNYATRKSSPEFVRFVDKRTRRSVNYGAERLIALLSDFDETWENDLRTFLDVRREEALNSVKSLRNRIAHGDDVSLGYAQMRDYTNAVYEVIDHVYDLLGCD